MSVVEIMSTVEWHKHTNLNRPYVDGDYLVITKGGWLTTLPYRYDVNKFSYGDDDGSYIEVAYWADIPFDTSLLIKSAKRELANSKEIWIR